MDSQSTEERAEKVIIALTPEQLKDICANAAEIGAKEALKTYEQERKRSRENGQTDDCETRSCSCVIITCSKNMRKTRFLGEHRWRNLLLTFWNL